MLEVETVSSSIIPSLWASMNSWLTPTVLFLFLNLMIGTIAFTSNFPRKHLHSATPDNNPPSPFLQRLRSFNLSPSQPLIQSEKIPDQSPPSVLQRLRSINLSPNRSQPSSIQTDDVAAEPTLDEVYVRHVSRTKSETATEAVTEKLPARIRKSASMKSPFGHFEEDEVAAAVEARRPATVKEARVTEVDDDEVDAKADDFINRFKQQLKLQRMDSIVRYKETIGRGGAM